MKRTILPAFAALCLLSSCEKVKSLAGGFGQKAAPAAPATVYEGPLVSEIPEDSFESFPKQPGRVVVIDFYADWCGPCRALGPMLDKIANEHGGTVLVGRVNVDKSAKIAANEGVNGIPDVRIFRDGKLVDKFVGCPDESEVRRRIEAQAKGLTVPPKAPAADDKTKADEPVAKPMPKDWLPAGMKRR